MAEYVGCFKDSQDRTFKTYAGMMTVGECNDIAVKERQKYFGMQHGEAKDGHMAECWTIPLKNVLAQDRSADCFEGRNGELYGKMWTNAIYRSTRRENITPSPIRKRRIPGAVGIIRQAPWRARDARDSSVEKFTNPAREESAIDRFLRLFSWLIDLVAVKNWLVDNWIIALVAVIFLAIMLAVIGGVAGYFFIAKSSKGSMILSGTEP